MSRRAKVAKHAGIYYRDDANGKRRYEVDYYDSEGRPAGRRCRAR